jgi:hypothetical protein
MLQQICPGLQQWSAQQNCVESQTGAPLEQGGLSQWPLLQNDVSPVHGTPQPPQFVGSLLGLMHEPSQHFVNWLHAGVQVAPPELEPLEPPDPELVLEPPLLVELPPLDPELVELPPDEPLPLLLPPSFPPLPSTEASPPPRTSVAPPQ